MVQYFILFKFRSLHVFVTNGTYHDEFRDDLRNKLKSIYILSPLSGNSLMSRLNNRALLLTQTLEVLSKT